MTKLFEKGMVKTGGRKKGVKNKVTADLKKMVNQALINKGGVSYLEQQATDNPVAFMALLAKTMPKESISQVHETKTFEINMIGLDPPSIDKAETAIQILDHAMKKETVLIEG